MTDDTTDELQARHPRRHQLRHRGANGRHCRTLPADGQWLHSPPPPPAVDHPKWVKSDSLGSDRSCSEQCYKSYSSTGMPGEPTMADQLSLFGNSYKFILKNRRKKQKLSDLDGDHLHSAMMATLYDQITTIWRKVFLKEDSVNVCDGVDLKNKRICPDGSNGLFLTCI